MTPSTPGGSARKSRTTRVIRATPSELWDAFVDEDVLLAWLPPKGMTGRMHAFDARVGGGYEMSLYYPPGEERFKGKSGEREDRVTVRFVEMEPPRRIVETVRFVSDDPAFAGEMTLTITLEPVDGGTSVTMTFEGIPPGVRPEDNDAGTRASLAQLARRFA